MKRSGHIHTKDSKSASAYGHIFPYSLLQRAKHHIKNNPLAIFIAGITSIGLAASSLAVSAHMGDNPNDQTTSTTPTSVTEVKVGTSTSTTEEQEVPEAQAKAKASTNTHASSSRSSASVNVSVNGEEIDIPKNGRVHKVIKDDNGSQTVVDINTQQSGNSHSFSHSYSSSVSTSSGGDIQTSIRSSN